MQVSPAYISQRVKEFLSWNLISKVQTHPKREGKRDYNHFYTLSPEAKELIRQEDTPSPQKIQTWHVHHIGIKYKITRQSDKLSKDKRISGSEPGGWKLRGHNVVSYWYPGKAGDPSVTLYVHSKTILAWIDKNQLIIAPSIEDTERLADQAIQRAMDLFIERQRSFKVYIETDRGTNIGDRHYGGMVPEKHPTFQKLLSDGIEVPGWHADKSPDDKIPGMGEIETPVKKYATDMEKVLDMAPELVKIPDMIRDTINPLGQQINRVEAMMQGGRPIELQQARLMDVMVRLLERLEAQDKRIEKLEGMMKG